VGASARVKLKLAADASTVLCHMIRWALGSVRMEGAFRLRFATLACCGSMNLYATLGNG